MGVFVECEPLGDLSFSRIGRPKLAKMGLLTKSLPFLEPQRKFQFFLVISDQKRDRNYKKAFAHEITRTVKQSAGNHGNSHTTTQTAEKPPTPPENHLNSRKTTPTAKNQCHSRKSPKRLGNHQNGREKHHTDSTTRNGPKWLHFHQLHLFLNRDDLQIAIDSDRTEKLAQTGQMRFLPILA